MCSMAGKFANCQQLPDAYPGELHQDYFSVCFHLCLLPLPLFFSCKCLANGDEGRSVKLFVVLTLKNQRPAAGEQSALMENSNWGKPCGPWSKSA